VRRGRLELRDLYDEHGAYVYHNGINPAAMIAMVAGLAVATVGLIVPALRFLFDGAWFSAAIVAGVLYWMLMKRGARG